MHPLLAKILQLNYLLLAEWDKGESHNPENAYYIHINRAVLSCLSNVTIHSNKRTSGSIALLSTIWHYSRYHLFKEIKQTIKLHIHFGSDHIIKGGKMFNTIRTKYLKNTVPSQGPRHTKDIIKMVPVVPLFGNQH